MWEAGVCNSNQINFHEYFQLRTYRMYQKISGDVIIVAIFVFVTKLIQHMSLSISPSSL